MKRPLGGLVALLIIAGAAPALKSEDHGSDRIFTLPPFLVEDQEIKFRFDRPDWIYGEVAGLEILSACDADETRQFVEGLRLQRIELGEFIPDDFFLHTTLPTTLILFPKSLMHTMDEEIAREIQGESNPSAAPNNFRPMQDLRLTNPDSSYIFVVLDDWQWRVNRSNGNPIKFGSNVIYSPSFLRFLIESRAPALPDWFDVGVTRLYGSILFPWHEGGIKDISARSEIGAMDVKYSMHESKDVDGFAPDAWLSENAAKAIRGDGWAPRPLLPMRELFVPTLPKGKTEEYRRVWEAQAELFLRWALYTDPRSEVTEELFRTKKERLQRFVAASATAPVTEESFRSCFGVGYADARDALSDFLQRAVQTPLKVAFMPVAALRPLVLQDATFEEIHRIKGEWSRRTLRVVREGYPKALPLYVEQTRKLLQGAYDHGERDPGLLASLALFRIDLGDTKGAMVMLEENPAAANSRPLARLELAKIHLLDALRKPAGPKGTLSEDQAAMVLGEVTEALRRAPAIEDAYILAAAVSQHLSRDPTGPERARLNEGAQLFPRNSQLVIECASWDLRADDVAEARKLIGLGMWEASDRSAREKMALLNDLSQEARPSSN